MYMFAMRKAVFALLIAAASHGLAGDGLYDADGSYAGTVSKIFWQTETGEYGGSVFKNGCLSDGFGAYAGRINRNGSITLADGSYGGHVAGWKARDGE